MSKNDMWYIEIVKKATEDSEEEVVERMGPKPSRIADMIERGANINLNHDDYFVRQVPAEGEK